jgi:hypothetical protein
MNEKLYEKRCFDLFLWQHGGDHFTCMLFTLIHKADPSNVNKLREGFPVEVAVWEEWMATPSAAEFYLKHTPDEYNKRYAKCNTGTS